MFTCAGCKNLNQDKFTGIKTCKLTNKEVFAQLEGKNKFQPILMTEDGECNKRVSELEA